MMTLWNTMHRIMTQYKETQHNDTKHGNQHNDTKRNDTLEQNYDTLYRKTYNNRHSALKTA